MFMGGIAVLSLSCVFGHAARHPNGELIAVLILPTPRRTWRRRTGGQPKTWATEIKSCLEPLPGPQIFGYPRWRKDWVKVSSELAQNCRAWGAPVSDVVNSIGDTGAIRRG